MTKLTDLWKIDPEYGYPDLNQATVGDLVEVLADPEVQEALGATQIRGDLEPDEFLVVPLSRLEEPK